MLPHLSSAADIRDKNTAIPSAYAIDVHYAQMMLVGKENAGPPVAVQTTTGPDTTKFSST